ncbi:MAG TPA: CGNR zinc finger domain-containing protein [Actinomycetota bacterium]|nr:CGNR zinc finger domain-containing protein [Actinomycetota bacterium]
MRYGHDVEEALALAEGLVNSHLPSGEHVVVDSPEALARLLEGHAVRIERRVDRGDLEEVERLRRRLREVFEASGADEAAAALNRILDEAGARPTLATHEADGWHVEYVPADASLARRLAARIGMALAAVVGAEGWDRLRVCDWESCRDVFVDRSRNRSRRFCSPQVCGNRASVAAWRSRQRAATRDSG